MLGKWLLLWCVINPTSLKKLFSSQLVSILETGLLHHGVFNSAMTHRLSTEMDQSVFLSLFPLSIGPFLVVSNPPTRFLSSFTAFSLSEPPFWDPTSSFSLYKHTLLSSSLPPSLFSHLLSVSYFPSHFFLFSHSF